MHLLHDAKFIELLKKYSFDPQQFFKKIADTAIYLLLVSKPEQESVLLAMLVEKLGDPDSTVCVKECVDGRFRRTRCTCYRSWCTSTR